MDINKLRYFCSVVEAQSIRAASEYLNISPGSLSRAMASLQREMKKELFVTSGRNLVLTEAGKAMYPRVKKLLEEYESLSGIERPQEQTIRLATFEVFSTHVLGGFIEASSFQEHVACYEMTPGKIEDAVANKTADLGISYIPIPNPEVKHLKVCSFHFGLYGHSKWRRKAISELPFAVPTTSLPMTPNQIRGLDTWPVESPRKIKFEFEMLETALIAGSSGGAVLFCPKFVVAHYNKRLLPEQRLVELEPRGVPSSTQHIYLIIRQNEPESPFSKKVASYLRKLSV